MTGDRDQHATEVLCAGCGGWFESDGRSRSVRCPLCSAVVMLGTRQRVRRRVRRTGVVDEIDLTPIEERGRRLRNVVVVGVCVLVAVAVVVTAVEVLPPIWSQMLERVGNGAPKVPK
ncbi:MAG: hypothetical protein K8T90_14815 [Planctomycetes bacterium]|nr:hypothetical protein [Planctomycetota bacterium]